MGVAVVVAPGQLVSSAGVTVRPPRTWFQASWSICSAEQVWLTETRVPVLEKALTNDRPTTWVPWMVAVKSVETPVKGALLLSTTRNSWPVSL